MNACSPHQFQYPFQDLDGDRRWRKTFGDHPDFMAPISGWWSKVCHYHPCMVEDDKRLSITIQILKWILKLMWITCVFFTHSHLNLWKFESRLSQSKRFVQNKKLQHQHINLLSYTLLSDALFSWILKTKDKGKLIICSTSPLFTTWFLVIFFSLYLL